MAQLDLADTNITSPSDKQGWRYNSSTGKWENNSNVAQLDVAQTWSADQTFSGADIKIGGG